MKSALFAGLLSVFVFSGAAAATPQSWLSTYYKTGVWSGSWYRSPVTDGHLDIRLMVDHVSFTDAAFSIKYDSNLISPLSTGSILEIRSGLSLVGAVTENLEGSWKKTTFTFSGSVVIGEVDYESEAVFRLRLIPIAEGTMPVTLWPGGFAVYPDSYHTCSLSLLNNGEEVVHERKEWNDGTQLFTFTDKTTASALYHFDFNFGYPVEGYLEVEYDDASVETFHNSDHDRGITIDAANGAYFISPLPNAVSYMLIFPGYEHWPVDPDGGWGVSHTQPTDHIEVVEAHDGFHGIRSTSEDIQLTIKQPGIGADFANAIYTAAMSGNETGVLSKSFLFDYIDDDTLRMTIVGGLEPDFNYTVYITKNGTLLGRAWFSASIYYPVTFTVKDENDNPIANALVSIPLWSMHGPSSISQSTDANGQAVIEMPGDPEWGQWHDYRVVFGGYSTVSDMLTVYSEPVDITVSMTIAPGTRLADFAVLSQWWGTVEECAWNDNCDGADMNYDGNVDMEDMLLFAACWMNAVPVN
jgi:hypothetical protein